MRRKKSHASHMDFLELSRPIRQQQQRPQIYLWYIYYIFDIYLIYIWYIPLPISDTEWNLRFMSERKFDKSNMDEVLILVIIFHLNENCTHPNFAFLLSTFLRCVTFKKMRKNDFSWPSDLKLSTYLHLDYLGYLFHLVRDFDLLFWFWEIEGDFHFWISQYWLCLAFAWETEADIEEENITMLWL